MSAAGKACDWDWEAPARRARAKRLLNEPQVVSKLVSCRTA